jgi:hypothetical protein
MLSSDQDEPSIWAKNIKRFKEGSFKREGAFESSQIRDLVTIGHVEDVNKYLLQLPDGPYSISDADIKVSWNIQAPRRMCLTCIGRTSTNQGL